MPDKRIHNVVVVSDLHCGCRLGLCPEGGIQLDDGGKYVPSREQGIVWRWWKTFWGKWVPEVTRGEPYAVVVNGDALDGVHHGATTQVSHNLEDQAQVALLTLRPVVEGCEGRFYMVRGTEAHVGKSAEQEERLARELGAVKNDKGLHARYDLWLDIQGQLIHFLHHVGTTSSNAYEATAVIKELTEEYNEAARWDRKIPDVIVRSHRHRHIEVRVPTRRGEGIGFVTPAWQLKTPFAWKIAGARLAVPQFGGSLIRVGEDGLYTRHKVWSIEPTRAVRI